MNLYLDVCCLNRPFDDQSEPRVAIESTAVLEVLGEIDVGRWIDFSSDMARIEISRIPDRDLRRAVAALLPPSKRILPLDAALLDAARQLERIGFGVADAVHLSAARRLAVDVFLTVDDKLLKRARRYAGQVGVRVTDPVAFLREVRP